MNAETMMKRIYTSILAAAAVLLTSCLGDLDPKDLGPNVLNASNVYRTKDDFKRGLAKLYASFVLSGQQGPAGQPDISGIDEGFGV
jgi:hypothetical protein